VTPSWLVQHRELEEHPICRIHPFEVDIRLSGSIARKLNPRNCIGIDSKGRMFLLDVWRQRTSSKVWIAALCDLVIKNKPIWFYSGQIVAGS
jgi:hypothetical protein